LMLFHIPCCTQDQLICSSYFVFFCFASLVVVIGVNGIEFFWFSCIDLSICPSFDCCYLLF
jgi:hypothetical protein